ncbi:MAG: 16S rRNA (adenine(1518)-N(6)/adenine(1519)-N(6))-dimethyltransferase RsmA [Ruminococcus sp.]|nr:16S rRNA (adenine(1518)-N(6)/adenine(1519)-N(6))-dimethyltransferase RsmA [Ruminococcus sp.]
MDNLTNILTIKDLLSRHGFTFSKALGQNFLINPSVCPRMAEFCGAQKGVGVIEVGPGFGVLTHELCKLADKVVSIELDKRLMPVLKETMAEHSNFKVINEDILKIDLHKLIEDEFQGMKVVVCANLPYYITSPVIMKLLEEKLDIEAITVMVQKEAAQRLCAKVGTRDSSAITVAVNYYSEPKLLFHVSSGSFMPAPKVDSAVIRLDISGESRVKCKNEKMFFKVVKAAFSQRRKTVLNSISSSMGVSKADVESALADSSISLNSRAEQLTLEDFAKIADSLYDRGK